MKIVLALSLFVAVSVAEYGGYPREYDYHELAKLEESAHRVASEKIFLKERLESMVQNNFDLMDTLNNINDEVIQDFMYSRIEQDDRLTAIKDKIKDMLHRVGDLEAALEGEAAVAAKQESEVNPTWARIEELTTSNTKQSAAIAGAQTLFNEANNKVLDTLNIKTSQGVSDINEVSVNAANFLDLAVTRRCRSDITHVEIDPTFAYGEHDVTFDPEYFTSNTPTVFCAIQGFQNRVNLDNSYGYGYGYGYGYNDDRQSLAMTVDCKAYDSKVNVKVFDQSAGEGNAVDFVYVEVKTCSFGPQAH